MIDLRNVVEKYPECLENPNKFKSYLKDIYPDQEDQVRIRILSDVMNCGIVNEIKSGKTDSISIAHYRTEMENKYGYSSRLVFECISMVVLAFNPNCSLGEYQKENNVTSYNESKNALPKETPTQKHIHMFTDTIVSPTCQEHGYTLHQCSCGYNYKDHFTFSGDHCFKLFASVPPTCTTSGHNEYRCAICDEKKYETIPPIDHQFEVWKTVSKPNCTQDGIQEYRCVMCNKIERKRLPSDGHQWSAWSTIESPTCTEVGHRARQCTICGKTEYEVIQATGHDFSEWSIPKTDRNIQERICRKCGKKEKESIYNSSNQVQNDFEIVNGRLKKYSGTDTKVVVPKEVEHIDLYAFYKCEFIKSVELPSGLKTIGESAFAKCSNLTHISISENLLSIDAGAFAECKNLLSIKIPDSVNSIGGRAFEKCISLNEIILPNSITSIPNMAFYECTSLSNITIAGNITSIGSYAFEGCKSLKAVYWCGTPEKWDNLLKESKQTFEGCKVYYKPTVSDRSSQSPQEPTGQTTKPGWLSRFFKGRKS